MTRLPTFPVLEPAPAAPRSATPSPVVGAVEPQYSPPPRKRYQSVIFVEESRTSSSIGQVPHPDFPKTRLRRVTWP
jgi:hypothetical protein